ncbi:tetratricopeptide repeat protein [Nocardiopsis sediminis]|uniref:Tetratricopeptide repeat protein n=1 Tax=Nocardiopsis sediminis TaxID=1778267 RepID=A0ABV8FUN1_9ACTN
MSAQGPDTGLARADRLLADVDCRLRHVDGERENPGLLAGARRCCDEAEAALSGDAEAAATIAVLRAVAATFALRHTVLFDVACDFDDNDGTLLGGMERYDAKGVSRPLADEAVRTAREALDADPHDPLVPLYLGHALTWSGDRDGAVAAYREALHRDPGDRCALSCLRYLKAAPKKRPSPDPMSRGRHGFALVRDCHMISNNDSDSGSSLFASAADARAHVDRELDSLVTGEDLEGQEGELLLQIHRPGRPVAEYDLNARIPEEPEDGPLRIDWSGIPLDEPLEPPLPPGRPLRIGGHLCFPFPGGA